ncbi:MAG: CpsD/CapB family tyrosine-protein kinase [Deltaproteobacteria bacterium]|nr:CpsD/CapB family tyrosine-protein kinase [Deltaproteobacteria bacterium]
MGEIHEALRRANRVPGTSGPPPPDPLRERQPDPEIVEAFRTMAPKPAAEAPPGRVGRVSHDKSGRWQSREVVVDAQGPASESLRHLALRLRRELEARNARSVAVLSAVREEGKTTLACNLALALASVSSERTVALVDLDLRKPRVASSFELRAGTGIEDVLAGRADLPSACVSLDLPQLDVYPAFRPQPDAYRTLSMPSLAGVVRELERRYEIVLVDTPPMLLVPDAALILGPIGTAIVVGRAGRSTRSSLEATCKLIPKDRLIGAILNEGVLPVRASSYGYYGDPGGE